MLGEILYIKKYENPSIKDEMNCQWHCTNFDDPYSASRWNTCQEIEQRTILVSLNVVLSSAEYFPYAPHFLLYFTSGLRACSILVTFLLAAAMAIEGILVKTICLVDMPSCPVHRQATVQNTYRSTKFMHITGTVYVMYYFSQLLLYLFALQFVYKQLFIYSVV